MPGYMGPYTSNRGMTLYPEQNYANNVAYYTPQPQQVGGGLGVGFGLGFGLGDHAFPSRSVNGFSPL